jgi:hypothetical protein
MEKILFQNFSRLRRSFKVLLLYRSNSPGSLASADNQIAVMKLGAWFLLRAKIPILVPREMGILFALSENHLLIHLKGGR